MAPQTALAPGDVDHGAEGGAHAGGVVDEPGVAAQLGGRHELGERVDLRLVGRVLELHEVGDAEVVDGLRLAEVVAGVPLEALLRRARVERGRDHVVALDDHAGRGVDRLADVEADDVVGHRSRSSQGGGELGGEDGLQSSLIEEGEAARDEAAGVLLVPHVLAKGGELGGEKLRGHARAVRGRDAVALVGVATVLPHLVPGPAAAGRRGERRSSGRR